MPNVHINCHVAVPRVELEDVEALIPLTVAPGGRITGLTDFVGRKVLVVVPTEPRKRSKKGADGS